MENIKQPLIPKGDSTGLLRLSNYSATRLSVLSFFLGVLSMVFSQLFVVYQTTAAPSFLHFESSAFEYGFYIVSAMFTYVVSHAGPMSLFLVALKYRISKENGPSKIHPNDIFLMESYNVAGSLMTISSTWYALGTLRISESMLMNMTTLLGCAWILFAVTFALVAKPVFSREVEEASTTHQSGHTILAISFGSSIGMSTQFLLSILLWRTGGFFANNSLLFSIFWSLTTTVISLMGNILLKIFIRSETTVRGRLLHVITVRAEYFYVLSSLTGICFAWLFMDVTMGLHGQLLSSLGVFGVSVLLFHVIVYLIPEEDCVAELEAQEIAEDCCDQV